MKKIKNLHEIEMGILPAWVFVTKDPKAALALFQDLKMDTLEYELAVRKGSFATTFVLQGHHKYGNQLCCMMVFWNWPKKPDINIYAVVSHEASHVMHAIFEDIGEEKPGDEIKAYTIQYLTQRTIQILEKK